MPITLMGLTTKLVNSPGINQILSNVLSNTRIITGWNHCKLLQFTFLITHMVKIDEDAYQQKKMPLITVEYDHY